jgi:hypothetical protein
MLLVGSQALGRLPLRLVAVLPPLLLLMLVAQQQQQQELRMFRQGLLVMLWVPGAEGGAVAGAGVAPAAPEAPQCHQTAYQQLQARAQGPHQQQQML